MSSRENRTSFDYSGAVTSVITPSAKIDLAPFTSTKWRETAERAGLTGKMWPASTKIGLEAVMGTKWREAAERVAGVAEVRAKMWPGLGQARHHQYQVARGRRTGRRHG
jgi:hypothetical protein